MEEGYVEVSVTATVETAEALADFLFSEGALGLVIEDPVDSSPEVLMRASFPGSPSINPIIARLAHYQKELKTLGLTGAVGRIETRQIPSEDWGKTWKEHFRPLAVGKRLVIAPPWEDGPFPENRLLLRVDPGMSFGTGHHATTRMCLEVLEASMGQLAETRGPTVLDVGTGTGILAIAAAALGAERVVAIDTDPDACEGAARNLALNNVTGRVKLFRGGIETLEPDMQFDLIVANLDAKGFGSLFDSLLHRLSARGRLVASGILVEDEEKFVAAASASGFRLLGRQSEAEWLCLVMTPDRQSNLRTPPP